jgi:putative endonuclease
VEVRVLFWAPAYAREASVAVAPKPVRAKADIASASFGSASLECKFGCPLVGSQMKTVYILQSESNPDRFDIGVADDVHARVQKHNSGGVTQTSKYLPWRLKSYTAFADDQRAFAFEKYLKSGSGRAFSKKRL